MSVSKLAAAFEAIKTFLSHEPAILAAVLNICVAVAAYFGLHITGNQLIYVVGVATALFGALVRAGVIPLSKK